MNGIERELRSAADRIKTDLPPGLHQRLIGALAEARQEVQGTDLARFGALWRPRLAAGLALAASIVAAVVAWPMLDRSPAPATNIAVVSVPVSYGDPVTRLSRVIDDQGVQEARLEEELQRLNSDWQRIRSQVREQIDPLL